MSRFFIIILMSCTVLSSCRQDEELQVPTTAQHGIVVKLRYDAYRGETRSALRQTADYDRVEYCVVDGAGSVVGNVKGVYDTDSSELKIEGLHEGDYRLLLLGIRGDWRNDGIDVRKMVHIEDTWITFPDEILKPLGAEYFYSQTPFTVTARNTGSGNEQTTDLPAEIIQNRIVGRTDFSFVFNNTYVRTAVLSKSALLTRARFYTGLTGTGSFVGESASACLSLDLNVAASCIFLPTVDGSAFTGEVEVITRNYRGNDICRTYGFELPAVEANRIGRIDTCVIHPDDESGTMFITETAYAEGKHAFILQDGEPKTVYADPALRAFNTSRPLQISATEDGLLHVRFYSPRALNGVLIKARIPRLGNDCFDLAYFDHIPAFAEFYETLPITQRKSICRTESGRWMTLPQMDPSDLDGIEFEVESKDPYWAKLKKIIHGWNISFHLYGGDPDLPDGGPAGNWMGIRPVHCREAVALFLNFTYMIDMPEHEEILRANEDRLYGNGGVDDKVTAETVLRQMRQERTLRVGLVYPGNGVVGLGGGNVFGAYQQSWLQHYSDTYSCEILFHELGHVMGYSHSSSFTYGPWAQELMNRFYVDHIDRMPIDSPAYLNSSMNPNLY